MQMIDLQVWFEFFFFFFLFHLASVLHIGGRAAGLSSVGRDQGLPHAGHRWFHLVPTNSVVCPPQDTAEPISKASVISVKMHLRGQKVFDRQNRW